MSDIGKWLSEVGLEKYVSEFAEAEIEFTDLVHLTDQDLKEIGLPLGPRRRAIEAIKRREEISGTIAPEVIPNSGRSPEAVNPKQTSASDAERRHLTVMFVDLVGSTEMAGRLDPEDMRDVITNYQDMVAGVVGHYEGFVAKFMGDGVLCYFGWPRASEDDPERAVRASLSIVDTVKKMEAADGTPLATRIGIATGVVIVGDLIGSGATQETAVVGETPNLAARLQDKAEPNQIVLPFETKRLLGNSLMLRPIGYLKLKGISESIEAFVAEGEAAVESRFAAQRSENLTPMVGRDWEIGLMLDRWAKTCSGSGQLLIVTGEAGIGKSRLANAVLDKIGGDDHLRMTYQCSRFHTDTSLYPIIQQMSFAAGIVHADTPNERLDKLEALLGVNNDALKLVAPMMGLDGESRYGELELTPAQRRVQTMQVLIDLLVDQSKIKPLLLLIEDLHWIDPTTLELLDILLDSFAEQQIMVLSTARPTFEYGFDDHPLVTRIELNRLGENQIAVIASELTNGKTLPDEIMKIISSRTDGVPLFVEELTKTILESTVLKEEKDCFIFDGPLSAIAIPTTLHDSLMARLDRLGSAKKIAQIGAAIGREFDYRLLKSLWEDAEDSLKDQLSVLTESQLIFISGSPPNPIYTFRHALIQDAAYESLLKSRRRELHLRIGTVLEERLPRIVDTEPEILAHHYTNAELFETAIIHWHNAGQKAIERSANIEAISHLNKGIDLLGKLPKTVELNRQELDLRMALGTTLMLTKGFAAPEVENTFTEAVKLCGQIGDTPKRFSTLWGINYLYAVRSPGAKSELAEQLFELAQTEKDQSQKLVAHRVLGSQLVLQAKYTDGLEILQQGLSLYDPEEHRSLAFTYGQDIGIVCQQWSAWAHWFLGYPDQALNVSRETTHLAQEMAHPMTEVYVTVFAAMFHRFRRENKLAGKLAEKAAIDAAEQGFGMFLKSAMVFQGSLLTMESMTDGITLMQEGLTGWRATGAELFIPFYLSLLAEAYGEAGETTEGLAALDEALTVVSNGGINGERMWDAELCRIKGVLLLGNSHEDEAEACFQEALQISRTQRAKSWELRAAVSLSILWKKQGRKNDARELLQEVYDWFTEGFDTPDLIDAKVLLEELR